MLRAIVLSVLALAASSALGLPTPSLPVTSDDRSIGASASNATAPNAVLPSPSNIGSGSSIPVPDSFFAAPNPSASVSDPSVSTPVSSASGIISTSPSSAGSNPSASDISASSTHFPSLSGTAVGTFTPGTPDPSSFTSLSSISDSTTSTPTESPIPTPTPAPPSAPSTDTDLNTLTFNTPAPQPSPTWLNDNILATAAQATAEMDGYVVVEVDGHMIAIAPALSPEDSQQSPIMPANPLQKRCNRCGPACMGNQGQCCNWGRGFWCPYGWYCYGYLQCYRAW